MRISAIALTGIIVLVALAPSAARADMISLWGAENSRNIAEIRIDQDGVDVALELFPEDLPVFQDLLPDEWFEDAASIRPNAAERLRTFATEVFQFVADGEQLPVRVSLLEPRMRVDRYSPLAGKVNPYTGARIPGPPEDKRVLYIELRYPFPTGTRPDSLTIIPPMGDRGFAAAMVGFVLFHEGVSVVDFSSLSVASTLLLDWQDPWYTRFAKKNLKRWQESGMMTFLYIEPYEVRHEMLVRVKDMMPLLDLGLRDPAWIEEDEFKGVESAIGDFLLEHSNVLIDGDRQPEVLDRINFVRYTRRRTLFLTEPERLSVPQAMLGVVVTYFTGGLPREVTMEWDLFTERVQKVPANAIDPAGPFPTYLTPDDPVHTWTNFLKTYRIPTVDAVAIDPGQLPRRLPYLSLILLLGMVPAGLAWRSRTNDGRPRRGPLIAGAALVLGAAVAFPLVAIDLPSVGTRSSGLDQDQSKLLVESLLRNVYRSFDFRDEEDVYDKLAVTVAGELLTDIYLQNRQSFEVQQAGGAQAKVQGVEILEVTPERAGRGYRLDATWVAGGSVGHWGHVHIRTNRYNAIITIEPEDGAWKITGMEVLDEERIDPGAALAPAS